MSRALLSEACESGESWRCLPSSLGTATTGCVLGRECVSMGCQARDKQGVTSLRLMR